MDGVVGSAVVGAADSGSAVEGVFDGTMGGAIGGSEDAPLAPLAPLGRRSTPSSPASRSSLGALRSLGSADWVLSLTCISAPLNGTALVYALGETTDATPRVRRPSMGYLLGLLVMLLEFLDLSVLRWIFDFRLGHFRLSAWRFGGRSGLRSLVGLARAVGGHSEVFEGKGDNAAYDMTIHSACRWNRRIVTHPQTVYMSLVGSTGGGHGGDSGCGSDSGSGSGSGGAGGGGGGGFCPTEHCRRCAPRAGSPATVRTLGWTEDVGGGGRACGGVAERARRAVFALPVALLWTCVMVFKAVFMAVVGASRSRWIGKRSAREAIGDPCSMNGGPLDGGKAAAGGGTVSSSFPSTSPPSSSSSSPASLSSSPATTFSPERFTKGPHDGVVSQYSQARPREPASHAAPHARGDPLDARTAVQPGCWYESHLGTDHLGLVPFPACRGCQGGVFARLYARLADVERSAASSRLV